MNAPARTQCAQHRHDSPPNEAGVARDRGTRLQVAAFERSRSLANRSPAIEHWPMHQALNHVGVTENTCRCRRHPIDEQGLQHALAALTYPTKNTMRLAALPQVLGLYDLCNW
jgi:hypothetical protein